jgi:hypothetical protein
MDRNPAHPVCYSSSAEHVEDDETDTARELMETMRGICETTFKHGGHAIRSVHAKSHGIVEGTLKVSDGLAPELAQGIFAQPSSYPIVMRFSTSPGDMLPDDVSTPRGLAIKIIGVKGERLPGSEGHVTQDFLMVNGPAFLAPTGKAFLKNLKLLAATTDRAPHTKEVLSATLRGVESVLEAFGGESARIKSMGGHPLTHILGETFFTQAPLLHGDHIAKLSIRPVSPELTALKDAPLDLKENPDGLREAVNDFFGRNGGEWELCVQLCTDPEKMPVEDASVEWSQDLSPFVPVARIKVKRQTGWSRERSAAVDDGMSFSPWHGIAAHRPLGSIMRMRKMSYEMSARFRSERNAVAVEEPKTGKKAFARGEADTSRHRI